MKNPKIAYTFLIAAYNEEKYIETCIRSCLNQRFVHGSVEVVCVDDGSTDDTQRIVSRLAHEDRRVIFDSFPVNRGKVAAFNRAYELSTGEIIGFLGADDVAEPTRAFHSCRALRSPLPAITVGSITAFNDSDPAATRFVPAARSTFCMVQTLWANPYGGTSMSFTRRAATHLFPIPETLPFEDWWISINTVNDKLPVHRIVSSVTRYRIHGANDSRSTHSVVDSVHKDWRRHSRYYDVLRERKILVKNEPSLLRVLHAFDRFKRKASANSHENVWKELFGLIVVVVCAGGGIIGTARTLMMIGNYAKRRVRDANFD